MKHKVLIVGLAILAVLLTVRGYLVLSKVDRIGPTITIPDKDIVYTDGEDVTNLLDGVTAIDQKDGDVTDTLVVEDIDTDEEMKKVIVTYAAVDRGNNLTKISRLISYSAIDVGEGDATPEPTETVEPTQKASMVLGSSPMLFLKTKKVTIKVNDDFTFKDFIAHIVDDKDSEEKLFKRIKEKGDYKVTEKGTYELSLSVVDSDENESNVETVTLVVE